jgi:hypothetical protein
MPLQKELRVAPGQIPLIQIVQRHAPARRLGAVLQQGGLADLTRSGQQQHRKVGRDAADGGGEGARMVREHGWLG